MALGRLFYSSTGSVYKLLIGHLVGGGHGGQPERDLTLGSVQS